MVYARRIFSLSSCLKAKLASAVLLASCAAVLCFAAPVKADPIAADGSVGVNTKWETGASTNWYIELQRQGIFDIVCGIRAENDAEIRAGLQQFDWGWAHQSADGSFPGTAGGSTGQEFHSSSLFVEAAARAALLLKSYSPITYAPDSAYYNSVIARYAANVHAAALWLTTPSVAAAGQAYNQPFTHRRYLLAATLAEASALTGDSSFAADAVPYIQDGLSLQLGPGWRAAVLKTRSGQLPVATLIRPAQQIARGSVLLTDAAGVNPEQNGYDTEYQCLGIYYANIYLPYCTDLNLSQRIASMINAGLTWESRFITPDGQISIAGDSRMGVELDRNGNVKEPTKGVTYGAFSLGAQNTGNPVFQLYATRIANQGVAVDMNAVAGDGAVDANAAWEQGAASTWCVGNQKIGADYVESGIAEENDALIQQGLQIINWGFNHQASDGSFSTTTSALYATACFIEAAARAAHDLQQYSPQTYAPTVNYGFWASSTLGKCVAAGNWMTSPATVKHYASGISGMTSHEWFVAASLSETGAYTGNSNLQTAGYAYAMNAVNLQTTTGEDPESGQPDINNQAIGLNAAMHFASACSDSQTLAATLNAANQGLLWEAQNIDPFGNIAGLPAPAIRPMRRVYAQAGILPDSDYFQVVGYRIGGPPPE